MELYLPEASGRLRYNPPGAKRHTLILEVSGDWIRYARWLTRGVTPRRWTSVQDPDFNIGGKTRHDPKPGLVGGDLLRPDWGCHITIIRGERLRANEADWGRWERGEDITFAFDLNPWYNAKHLWFDVECGYLETIREHYGLRPFRNTPHLQAGTWCSSTPDVGNHRQKFR